MKQHMGAVGIPARSSGPLGRESQRGTPRQVLNSWSLFVGEGTGQEQHPVRGSSASVGLEAGVFMCQFLRPVQCPEGSWAGQLWQKQREAPLWWGWKCPLGVPGAGQRAGARGPFLSTQAYSRCLMNAGTLLGVKSKANEGSCSLSRFPAQP